MPEAMVFRTLFIGVAAITLWENSVPEDHKILLRYAARKTWQKCIDHVQDLSDKSHSRK